VTRTDHWHKSPLESSMFNSISNTAGLTLVQLSIIHCVALKLYKMLTTDTACWITLPLTHVLVGTSVNITAERPIGRKMIFIYPRSPASAVDTWHCRVIGWTLVPSCRKTVG